MDAARQDGVRVRGYTSCVLGCPYQGKIEPSEVARVTKRLIDMVHDYVAYYGLVCLYLHLWLPVYLSTRVRVVSAMILV